LVKAGMTSVLMSESARFAYKLNLARLRQYVEKV